MVQLCNQFKQLLKSLNISSEEQAQIRLSKNEVKELKSIKEKLQNLPRKRKTLDANFNFVDEEFDFQEMDVKEVEFRLAKSGSILGDLDTEMELDDSILFSLGVALGLYPQFAIPDEANPHRKDSEQFFHTKDKQYLSMHPNSFLGQNPDRLREKLPCGRQPWMLVYVGLLETIKPYLLNCTRIAAIPTLLLTSHLDTDSRCSRIVADGWLEINFTNSSDSLGLLCSAISIRNSFYELLEFYFSQNAELDQEQKMDLLLQFRRQIVDFFHRDIDCTLKYIVNADRQLMYRKQAGDISEIPADLLVTIRYESEETKADTRKGGISLTPYITYGCLIDKSKDFIDQPYLKSHFRCPTCDIHMICTPGEQIAHSNACKPTIEIVEKEKDENDEKMHMEDNKPDKIRYNCQICNQELFLTTTEILRHRQTH
ncbi:putative ATP-dependent RNA helicase DHX34 [Thelohanellus kitauei]|uniref:Putative ATP-dependent RNA helicase DHX34 n=1 Tax=Thelohanellus kitauei TaxID=669202 RepID=A0A0C2JBH6_THEKT|nr:putative ATP-dependent RNA helicase DHX34 [Thelohanellus kitauei]